MKIQDYPAETMNIGNYLFFTSNCGSGSFSELHKGIKLKNDGKHYFLKVYSKSISAKIKGLIEREIYYSKFFPNCVVKFVEKLENENSLYLIYEYFISTNLRQFFSTKKDSLNIETKLKIAWNIANAINLLHSNKWMHCTLQLNHILVNEDGEIKFSGLKHLYYCNDNKFPLEDVGTFPYKAPEIETTIALGNKYNEKVDIYSFGIILYLLFSGNEDVTEINKKISNSGIEIPKGIKDLIIKCTNKDPKIRISSSNIIDPSYYQINSIQQKEIIKINSIFSFNNIPQIILPLPNQKDVIKERSTLEPYQILGTLGEGSYAKVFKICNLENKKIYVLKEIKMEKLDNDKARELIFNESFLLRELRDLSFVTKIEETFIYNKKLCMILEYCNGGNLENHVNLLRKNYMKMNMADMKLIANNLAEGLKELHAKKNCSSRS